MRRTRRLRYLTLLSLPLIVMASVGAVSAWAGVIATATTDTTPATPTITSTGSSIYVNGTATNYVGTPGVFTVSDPGSTVTGYYYGFTNAGLGTFIPAGADGTVASRSRPTTNPR